MSDRPTCEGTRKDGAPCRSFTAGGRWCFPHDPANVERMREARTAGASKGGKVRALRGKRRKLDSAAGLLRFTADVVQDVLSGTVQPDVGRCVLYGCTTLRALIETGDLAKRVEALEASMNAAGAKVGQRWGS